MTVQVGRGTGANRYKDGDLGCGCPGRELHRNRCPGDRGADRPRRDASRSTPDLTVPGHPEIYAIGDATPLAGPGDRPLPGLATVSIQQARHVARAIRGGSGGISKPFHYFDKGALAVVGRGKAVCEIRGHNISGRLAFFTYLTVHMYYLSGGGPGHRVKVSDRLGQRTHRQIPRTR